MLEKFRQESERVYGATPKTHNCAQAVVEISGRLDLLPAMAACGAGRAPNGYCGALYGALQVVPESRADELKADFAEYAGALTCREIKAGNRTPCKECVAIGALLADRYGTETPK